MRRLLALAILLAGALHAAPSAALQLAGQLKQISLDADSCYRIHEINFHKEDIRFFLTDGYLIFSKPIAGRPLTNKSAASTLVTGSEKVTVMFVRKST